MIARRLIAVVVVSVACTAAVAENIDPRFAKEDICGRFEIFHINGIMTTQAEADANLRRIAAESTAPERHGSRITTSTLKSLSDKSLRAVWEAAQWPTDYEDPLDRGFSKEEQAQMLVLFPGLHEFLEHKERWHSASGKLFPREQK